MAIDQIEHIQDKKAVEIIYPGILERVKATITDSIVLVVLMLALTFIFSQFENVPDKVRIIGFIFIFGLYDPLFTSFFGGTIGHILMKIRVRRKGNQKKNILFPLAIIRYIIKVLLGWVSLLTVSSSDKSLAIHDMVIGSIVLYKEYDSINE